jgi:two-component system, NtrC family, sensor histidine kinase HupT/HoxJ
MDELAFVLLHISALTTGITLFMVIGMRRKREIHKISIALFASIFCWCTGMLAESYAISIFHYQGMFFTNVYFSAVGFVSVYIYLLGRSFSAGENINRLNYLTLILPTLNMAAIWTNDYHHLYFKSYSLINSELASGPLHHMQSMYAYPLIVFGLFYLIFFSIKNAGFFSKQSILITCGIIVPLTVDLAFVTKIATFSMYFEPISFTFGAICFVLAIIKYDFLNVLPIAVQTIVDHISDSYLVLNSEHDIVDYNKAFIAHFFG